MKPFFWTPLPVQDVEKTVFKEVDDLRAKVDKKELERMFGNAAAKKEAPSGGDGSGKSAAAPPGAGGMALPGLSQPRGSIPAKKQEIELIDPKRSYAVNIALARFKMPYSAIRDALLQLDEKILDEEKLSSLQTIAPTSEELEMLNDFDGDVKDLAATEQFFYTLKSVPALHDRIAFFLAKKRWDSQMTELKSNLESCELAAKALKESKNLVRLLETVLAVGNYVNGGTPKGGQFGFKLDTLTKLKNSKASDGSTLLHFVVQNMKQHAPSTHEGLKIDLAVLGPASRVEFANLQTEVNKVTSLTKKLRSTLDKLPEAQKTSTSDRFFKFFSEFHERSAPAANELAERFSKLESDIKDLLTFFAEEPGKSGMDALFGLWAGFVEEYKRSEVELVKKAELAEKARKTEAEKAKREAEREEKRIREAAGMQQGAASGAGGAAKPDASAVVDATLSTLSSSSAADLAAAVKAKRAMAGDKISAHRTVMKTLRPNSQLQGIALQAQLASGKFPSLNRAPSTANLQ